jgi:CRP/FNR family transcriptional regulator
MTFEEAFQLVPFLRALPAEDRERLRPYLEPQRLARGERVWRQGDPTTAFAFAMRGRVKLVKTSESGREVILELCGPGELLCASAVCSFAPYCCAAAAMEEDVEVALLPRRDVLELLERSPSAARAFLREVTARGMHLCGRVEQLSTGLVERRIATLLLRLAEQVGVPRGERGTWIPLELSRQDLADLCGTTIETAIRTMTRLGREGVVRSAARGLIVLDRRALERTARGPCEPQA